jgi:hypothetical protein
MSCVYHLVQVPQLLLLLVLWKRRWGYRNVMWPFMAAVRLIHTCHAAPMPCRVNSHMPCRAFSDSVVSFVKVRVVGGNIRTASEIGMLLVTTFVELRLVAGRSRTRAGRPHAVSGRSMLFHTYHAVPMPCCAVALRSRFHNGMVVALHGNGTGAAWRVWIKHGRTV